MPGIIKAGGRTDPAEGITLRAFHFDDVSEAYLDKVRSEAAKLIADARREAAKIKAKATEEGRQAAMQAVEASVRGRLDQQLSNALSAVKQAAERIDQSRQTWQKQGEKHLVQLASAIAARLCRRELNRGPELSLVWIREALEMAITSATITLRLHPQDHASLAGQIQAIRKSLAGLGAVEIVADSSISAGGCFVDTQFGSLDQQLEAQLARIAEELLG
jgi:flagellar assembly protein FliH